MASSGAKLIGTHPSTFHLDDAASCFLVRTAVPGYDSARVVRTADPAVLATCDLVFDVGGTYDHATLHYDHHQRGFSETFSEKWAKVKLSSFGLLYRHWGREFLRALSPCPLSDSDLEILYSKFYDVFVVVADAVDNGVSAYGPEAGEPLYHDNSTLASRVANMNPAWNVATDDADRLRRFLLASDLAGSEMRARVAYLAESWLPARRVVEGSYRTRHAHEAGGRVVVLEQPCPWKDLLRELEAAEGAQGAAEVLYVASYDRGRGQWSATAVGKHAGTFENRLPFPQAWRGLRDAELAGATGVEGSVFVHATGFLACNTTLEGMLEMCKRSIASQN
eukprot:m51a1_g10561 hypothetical protein (336) ;mRNA; r:9755-11024